MTRWAKRVDNNQAEIVAALRTAGYTVFDYHKCGGGVPDLLVSNQRKSIWLEVKQPGGRLTDAEQLFFDNAPGQKFIVDSAQYALIVCAGIFDQQSQGE